MLVKLGKIRRHLNTRCVVLEHSRGRKAELRRTPPPPPLPKKCPKSEKESSGAKILFQFFTFSGSTHTGLDGLGLGAACKKLKLVKSGGNVAACRLDGESWA